MKKTLLALVICTVLAMGIGFYDPDCDARAAASPSGDSHFTTGMYIGNGGTQTINHGLGIKPDFILIYPVESGLGGYPSILVDNLVGDDTDDSVTQSPFANAAAKSFPGMNYTSLDFYVDASWYSTGGL